MPFYVSTSGSHADEKIVLEDASNGTKVEIYAFGALLNEFTVTHNQTAINVIYGFQSPANASEHITPLFQGAKLSPFVCRLKEGHYTFENEKYRVEKYYQNREAIHGLIYDGVYTVKEKGTDNDSAFVTLSFDYDKTDPGYPFFYRVDVTYRLQSNNRLTIKTHIFNLSRTSIPISDGWHPYFTFGKQVNDLQLSMNTSHIVEFDARLLPTGNFLPYTDFVSPKAIENTEFDHCFVVNEALAGAACTLSDPQTGLQVSIYPEKSYPFLQVFIPGHRNCIAIENLSSLPDAFNNAVGLTILESAHSVDYTTMYQVQQSGSATGA